jgi:hypothetical protein
MERGEEERTLSTADLADPNPDGEQAGSEQEPAAANAPDTSRFSSRDQTDGRYDPLPDEANTEREELTEPGTADSRLKVGDASSSATTQSAATDTDMASPLFDTGQTERCQSEWEAIQTGFVDEPRRAVEEADRLVADLMQRLAASFAQERNQLETQWDRGDDVSTEDLRLALQRYRSFFRRLLQA